MDNNNLFWENTVKKTITVPTGKEELRNITATTDCLKDKFSVRKMVKTVAVCVGFLAFTATIKAQTPNYHHDDIAAINAIISNNGLDWDMADPDGSVCPPNWTSDPFQYATWSGDPTNKRITRLIIYTKNLTGTLDVSALTALEYLRCNQNNLTELNVSNCTALEYLECTDNNLTTLNVTGLNELSWLDVRRNYIAKDRKSVV